MPVTSRIRGYGSEVTIERDPGDGLEAISSAQCQHIRAIAIERLAEPIGNASPEVLRQMRDVWRT